MLAPEPAVQPDVEKPYGAVIDRAQQVSHDAADDEGPENAHQLVHGAPENTDVLAEKIKADNRRTDQKIP